MALRVGTASSGNITSFGTGAGTMNLGGSGSVLGVQAPGTDVLQPGSNIPQPTYTQPNYSLGNVQTAPKPTYSAPPAPSYVAPDGKTYQSPEAYQAQVVAERKAKANALKSGLTGIVGSINGVYDALYGDVNVAAADKNKAVLENYNQDTQDLTSQFTDEFPAIGLAFSGRNTYDSSYRTDREDAARAGFDRTLEQRGRARDTDQSEVGKWVAQQQGGINADKGLVNTTLQQLMGSENPDEIQQAINGMQSRLAEVTASRSGLKSKASYMDTLNAAVPGGSRLAELRPSLSNVIKSQVPTALKAQIAGQLVKNAGLTPQEAAAALSEFNMQLSEEERLQQPVATA